MNFFNILSIIFSYTYVYKSYLYTCTTYSYVYYILVSLHTHICTLYYNITYTVQGTEGLVHTYLSD